jgi:hypothetical protein
MFHNKLKPIIKSGSPHKDFTLKAKSDIFSQYLSNSITLDPRDVRIRIPFESEFIFNDAQFKNKMDAEGNVVS